MRYLDRDSVPAPGCLAHKSAAADGWERLTWADREEIRAQLGVLQNNHCAYCESDLARESAQPHIEHFEQRSRARSKTFAWSNLFWSCSHQERCGKHKDSVANSYLPGIPLKPDVEDPRRYLRFTRDGHISPRAGLDPAAKHRAEETIRVFALDHPDLVAARRAYLAGPFGVLRAIELEGFDDSDCGTLLREEARSYEWSAFSAAILDLFRVEP